MQPLVGCSLSLQVARWPWIYHLGMEPSHQVTSALLLMLSLRNGKGSTLFSLHGHGYLGQNHHGWLLMKLVLPTIFSCSDALVDAINFMFLFLIFCATYLSQVEGYLSLENMCILRSCEVWFDVPLKNKFWCKQNWYNLPLFVSCTGRSRWKKSQGKWRAQLSGERWVHW